jgi:hypothetical protein
VLLELNWGKVHETENCSGLLFPYYQTYYVIIVYSSIFSLVQFPNSECTDANGDCGTCLTGVSHRSYPVCFICDILCRLSAVVKGGLGQALVLLGLGLAASSSLILVGGPSAGTGHISGTLGTLPPTAPQEHAPGPWPRVRTISARLG